MSEDVHFLVVEPFEGDAVDCLTIEHPERCATLDVPCHVGHYEDDGVTAYFRHADDPDVFADWLPAVQPGRHPIEGWTERVTTWPAVEYDGGLRLVDGG